MAQRRPLHMSPSLSWNSWPCRGTVGSARHVFVDSLAGDEPPACVIGDIVTPIAADHGWMAVQPSCLIPTRCCGWIAMTPWLGRTVPRGVSHRSPGIRQ